MKWTKEVATSERATNVVDFVAIRELRRAGNVPGSTLLRNAKSRAKSHAPKKARRSRA